MQVNPDVTVQALTPLRKIIAARMTEAKQVIPHYRMTADIMMDNLLALRKAYNSTGGKPKVSVNDYIIQGVAQTLTRCPALNVQFIDGEMHQYHHADIAVVMAVEGGLSTPIIRKANEKSLKEIAGEVKRLAARAQEGSLTMDDIVGGSFSVSNLGMYGVNQFDAIINPPQCAILAVGAVTEKMVVNNGEATIAQVMRVTLSLDHRVIDGAVGAVFLSSLKNALEHPDQKRG